eukprot:COSAG05_NODE_259_length_12737_cov_42.436145_8_plen_121_part_00
MAALIIVRTPRSVSLCSLQFRPRATGKEGDRIIVVDSNGATSARSGTEQHAGKIKQACPRNPYVYSIHVPTVAWIVFVAHLIFGGSKVVGVCTMFGVHVRSACMFLIDTSENLRYIQARI